MELDLTACASWQSSLRFSQNDGRPTTSNNNSGFRLLPTAKKDVPERRDCGAGRGVQVARLCLPSKLPVGCFVNSLIQNNRNLQLLSKV